MVFSFPEKIDFIIPQILLDLGFLCFFFLRTNTGLSCKIHLKIMSAKCRQVPSEPTGLTYWDRDKILDTVLTKFIFLNESFILMQISLKFIFKRPTEKMSSSVQVLAWHQENDKPLDEVIMTHFTDSYMRHWCINASSDLTRLQCIN